MSTFDPFPSDQQVRVERALEDIAAGRLVILVDDEDRENEGDLVMAADKVTADAINFMAVHGRGLVCVSLTPDRVEELGLDMMVRDNASPYGTAFTVSIEARSGVSTGISAADRAHTIKIAADPDCGPRDIVSPGHVFPLRARPGGVLVRAGQTEGSVDIARLAGCQPAGVLCEIMNEDGTMSRLPELLEFAARHTMSVLTVADLIAYRMRRETLVTRVAEGVIQSKPLGEVRALLYRNPINDLQYLALVKGEVQPEQPALVRVTSSNLWTDALQGLRLDGSPQLSRCMELIGQDGSGVILYVLRPFDNDQVFRQFASVCGEIEGTVPAEEKVSDPYPTAFRDYGLGAQVLRDLGVRKIRLITSSKRRLVGVEGYGLEVVERVDLDGDESDADELAVLTGGRS
ncbi:MAG: 3,4-dihydroxy-2-butanone-4-phosphate synthase [Rickettsiales bacterium]|nr:3,4-dihydroxy-2-butanone-4-phosphate synthase [Rickettsiales bacterium]